MPTYSELLEHPQWKQKRKKILTRDSNLCLECANHEIKNYSKVSTSFDKVNLYQKFGNDGVINEYVLKLKNESDNSERVSYLTLNDILLKENEDNRYIVFYSLERNNNNTEIVSINYIEDITKSENEKHIFVKGLHVHHMFYQDEKLPWEYSDNALKTLCWICHKKFHKSQIVDWYDVNGNKRGILTPCDKCYGAGYLLNYKHVENGICFKCSGKRFLELF